MTPSSVTYSETMIFLMLFSFFLSSIQCCLQCASTRFPSGPPDERIRTTIALVRVYLRAIQNTSLEQGVTAADLQKAKDAGGQGVQRRIRKTRSGCMGGGGLE